jgi:hypothetical protein
MKARLLRMEPDGLAVVDVGGTEIVAFDRMTANRRPPVAIGTEFTPMFSYMLEEGTEPRLLAPSEGAAERLQRRDGSSYEAIGRILGIDAEGADGMFHVAKLACGPCHLPAPMDIGDEALIGRHIAFRIAQLEVWQA